MTDFCAQSHIFTVWSLLPDAINLESGENLADFIQFVWETNDAWNFLSFTLMIFMILSFDPDKRSFPSLEKSTVLTGAVWALIVCESPLLNFIFNLIFFYFISYTLFVHSLTVSSFEADAIKFPSPEMARSNIAPLWPINL
jgi:hypothetical protein